MPIKRKMSTVNKKTGKSTPVKKAKANVVMSSVNKKTGKSTVTSVKTINLKKRKKK